MFRPKNEKGQASLMVAVMMMTFLFFFCFVVNVGMLVNAKIQLQNAADLAAYAGAAVQARHLNRISYLNYEMRRQYKKFLFRYYILGNMKQKKFPTTEEGNKPQTPYHWTPDPNGPTPPDFNVPAVCLVFNANDNYCHVNVSSKISIPPPSSFDMINDALRKESTQLEKLRQKNCDKIGRTNLYTLTLWLYNGDPDASPDFGLGDTQFASTQTLVQALVKGLGLVPREILLRQRIKTLDSYINEPAKLELTRERVSGLSSSPDPHRHERTIQAYNSAFYTLGDHTFSSDGITMDELQTSPQIKLNDNKLRFDTWAIYYDGVDKNSDSTNDPSKIGMDCVPHLVPQTLKSDVTVGVSKDPHSLTYYAVRLKAKAKLLFNPWGSDGIELKAYAAAQPFGSRIGPSLTSDAWVRKAQPPDNLYSKDMVNLTNNITVGQVPNLLISEEDSLENGWNTREVLGMLLSRAFSTSSGPIKTLTESDIARGYHLAMAPNLYETKYYNIPNDLAPYVPNSSFSPGMFDSSGAAIFWAPLAPADQLGDLDAQLKSTIEDLFHEVGSDGKSAILKDALKGQLSEYAAKLKNIDLQACGAQKLAQGLDDGDCESFNMVRITNPLRPRPNAGGNIGPDLLQLPAWFMPNTAKEVLTSWNAPNDPPQSALKDAGRLGYSVKFVSFDSLTSPKIQSDSKTKPDNLPGSGDEEAKVDMNWIQH